jgi:hypothetical protein
MQDTYRRCRMLTHALVMKRRKEKRGVNRRSNGVESRGAAAPYQKRCGGE